MWWNNKVKKQRWLYERDTYSEKQACRADECDPQTAPGCSGSFNWSKLEGVSLTLCFVVWDWVKREAVMIFIGKASHTQAFFNLSISCSLPFTMRLIGEARSLGAGLESICQHNYMFSLVFIPLSLTNMICIYVTVNDNINKNTDLRESHLRN